MARSAVRPEESLHALVQCALALKENMQVELAPGESPKASKDQGSCQEASDEASQHSELQVSLHQVQTASSKATEAAHVGNNRDQCLPILDGILKIQETLQNILTNQHTLKGLVDGLLKAVTSIEARIQAIEQEMGLISRFTEELNAVDNETNWG